MEIKIEQKHLDIAENLVQEVNRSGRMLKLGDFEDYTKYRKLAEKKNISPFEKKELIFFQLRRLLIKTFSIDLAKADIKIVSKHVKNNLRILRKLLLKLIDINYYLETTFLEDIGLIKPKPFFEVTKKQMARLMKEDKDILNKNDLDKLEYTVFKLIDKIIFFDKKLLKRYKLREKIITKERKLSKQQLKDFLKKESELLHHLEAKLPPSTKITVRLFNKESFTSWISRIFSLIIAIEHIYYKEQQIIKKLKKSRVFLTKIDKKINQLVREKWDLLKVKENKILAIEETLALDSEWQKMSHDWSTVTDL